MVSKFIAILRLFKRMSAVPQGLIAEFLHVIYNFFMKKMIVISGKQYCGKDTLAKLLLEELKDFKRVGIGDAIKLRYANENHLTFDEIEKNKHLYRADLIKLGNWGRAQDPDYWLKSIIEMKENVIVPDVRVEHEIVLFKVQGAFAVRVEASFENRSKRATITNANDETETALDNYNGWDAIVDNNSDYKNLKNEADKLISILRKSYL